MPNKLEKIYAISRMIIYSAPAIVLAIVVFLILFPVERYNYYPSQPELSKFEFSRGNFENAADFGIFPLGSHRFIDLSLTLDGGMSKSCTESESVVELEKTYSAFLFPEGDPIEDEQQLTSYLFQDNQTKYPNGTLLHLAPTNEVYLISRGKRILFPGPEIFRAFGYSFDNLVEAEKSAIDLFPPSQDRVFLWTHPHPDGAIFQTFPSHRLYIVAEGEKHEIKNPDLLAKAWPEKYAIPVTDPEAESKQICKISPEELASGHVYCRFDRLKFGSTLGGYYNFSLALPSGCPLSERAVKSGEIELISEKSFATVKDSLRQIFASILNRYMSHSSQN